MCDLYLEFCRIFLSVEPIDSTCGHIVRIFDHHFFHLAAITVNGRSRLFMKEEKANILATKEGFGHYSVLHEMSRAKNLPSAYWTLAYPDEVWEGNPRCGSAKWVYIKEFDSLPYPYTVALVTERKEENMIVPVSSFPCRRPDIKKWRRGKKIY